MANPTGEIGQLRDEELPAVRVIVPADPGGRVFDDDLAPGDLVFDGSRPPSVFRCWGLDRVLILSDIDAAVAQAREYLRSVGYPAGGWSLA